MAKNWFGEEAHPSDELIWWNDVPKAKELQELRAAWDLVHSTPELTAAFKLLQEAVINKAEGDQADIDAGEDL